uniref:Uncharacterized protein n=1 Tax=Anguilla anguilla TaxID=7936 RepID=A0A0E9RZL0_ANGAN
MHCGIYTTASAELTKCSPAKPVTVTLYVIHRALS